MVAGSPPWRRHPRARHPRYHATNSTRERLAARPCGGVRQQRPPAYEQALDRSGLFDRRDAYHSPFGRCRDCAYLRYCDLCPLSIALAPDTREQLIAPRFGLGASKVLG